MHSTTQKHRMETACLRLHGPDGKVATRELAPDETLLIGSGNACGMVLPDVTVAAMHCTLSLVEGLVRVRDWNTVAGTYVDGERVESETDVPDGGSIQIGPYRIEVVREAALTDTVAFEALDKVNSLLGGSDVSHADRQETCSDTPEPSAHPSGFQDVPLQDVCGSLEEIRGSASEKAASRIENKAAETYDLLPPDDDTLELLKAEVELLEGELAERDARLAELESLADFDGEEGDTSLAGDSPEVVGLVERLEQLLDELERSDERMSTMADLLRAAEDANAAEAEERRQIEEWIAEIEQRLAERDRDQQAERAALQKKVADLTEQLERAERRLADAAAVAPHQSPVTSTDASSIQFPSAGEPPTEVGSRSSEQEDDLARMRRDNEELAEKLRQAEEERERLNERLDTADVEAVEARTRAAVDESLREERLAIAGERAAFSQERAALARERAELVRLRDQLEAEQKKIEKTCGTPAEGSSADERIRAFRDHLREIHLEEGPAPRPQGLSARIGRIWRRLEGRPLDTD